SESRRIAVDLHTAAPVVFWVPLEVGKARADHQQRVGVFHRDFRWLRAKEPDAAGGEGRIVRYDGLAEQGLHDRRGHQIGELLELAAGAKRALTGEDDRPLS